METTGVIKPVNPVIFAALLMLLSACDSADTVFEESDIGNAPATVSGTNETELADADAGSSADGSDSTVATNETADSDQDTADTAGADTVANTEDSGDADASPPDTTVESQPESQPSVEPDTNVLGLPTPGVAQFVTSACDSLPISTAVQSNTMSAPTAITTGQLVSGIIGAGSDDTNSEHYWSIALEPGDYHVVLDSKRVDDDLFNLGLRLSELHTNGGVTDLFSDTGEFDYRSRSHGILTVVVARTVLLRLTPNFSAEDYTFGIFANGVAVPAPFFSDCPTINSLSIDTAEALTLPQKGSSAGDRWYRADLVAGMYTLSSRAAPTDGSIDRVLYRITQVDQFGQVGRTVELGTVDELGPLTNINSAALNRDNSGPVWIRIQNLFNELRVEFTLNSGV